MHGSCCIIIYCYVIMLYGYTEKTLFSLYILYRLLVLECLGSDRS